jgi:hypothetical protein
VTGIISTGDKAKRTEKGRRIASVMASALYEAKDANLILLSDVGRLIVTTTTLYFVGKTFGFANLHTLPYLWVITFSVALLTLFLVSSTND